MNPDTTALSKEKSRYTSLTREVVIIQMSTKELVLGFYYM
jgi:hypothetical protein